MSVIKRSLSFTSEPPRDAVNEELAQAQGGLSLDAPTISESSASEKIKLTLNQCIPDNVKLCFVVFVDFFFYYPLFYFSNCIRDSFFFQLLLQLLFYCYSVIFVFVFYLFSFFRGVIVIFFKKK